MKEELVREWFERANHDLDAARILIKENVHFDVVLFHIHQAVEKYLKGYLIHKGWELKKIHDLETLMTEASNFDSELLKHLDFGRRLSGYYYEERYPPGPVSSCSKKEIEEMLGLADQIIKRLREGIN